MTILSASDSDDIVSILQSGAASGSAPRRAAPGHAPLGASDHVGWDEAEPGIDCAKSAVLLKIHEQPLLRKELQNTVNKDAIFISE